MGRRFNQLDSLRGIAALSVLIGHYCLIYSNNFLDLLSITPLYMFKAANEPVIFFFVLSGFVLYLSSESSLRASDFIIKRFFRIYIPYLAAMFFTFLFSSILLEGGVQGYGDWLSGKWVNPVTVDTIINHLILLVDFQTSEYNPVVWTLVHEMRISIVFPLLILLVKKYDWKIVILIGLALSTVCGLNFYFDIEAVNGFQTGYFNTIHYVLMFLIGSIVANNIKRLTDLYAKQTISVKVAIVITSILLFCYARALSGIIRRFGMLQLADFSAVIEDWAISLASIIFIVIAISSANFSKILLKKPINFLGKISYSFYLYHLPVLFASFHYLHGEINTFAIMLISLLLTFIVSTISYKFIEMPAIRLAKKLLDKRNKTFKLENRLKYLWHRALRNIHRRPGAWQTQRFVYHHQKMKEYRSE